MITRRYLIFGQPIDFVDCHEVADGFRSILRGWNVSEIAHDPASPAYLTFRKRGKIYDWDTPWKTNVERRIDDPSLNVMEAVCDFHYEFIDWFAERNPHLFYVHMAAVEFAGKAVLFPAVQKAGKSTIAMYCVQRGYRLLGDDVVGLSPEDFEAKTLGLLPRMRLPLHPSFAPSFHDFIGRHAGLYDKRWQYVDLDHSQILNCGESRPVAGIVILDRRPDVRASLLPAPASAAIKAMIDRNFGLLEHPGLVFDCFKKLALEADCRRLIYSDPAEAVDLLADAFGEQADTGNVQREVVDASQG